MKFQRYKFGLIIIALFSAACAGDNLTGAAQTDSNSTNRMTANAAATPPSATPTNATPTNATPANSTATNTTATNTAAEPQLDVPYVPTPQNVVDEMLKLAQVKGGDVLYDLGSGDGRIPITAAQRFGTRGVGIDLNPVRIKEANENARKAGVTDKVKFIEGDLFKEDFSEATVLTLYLLPDVNLKLRPKILQMKPGTRVVSHNYDMGDWQPETVKTIKASDGTQHYVYFWRVPKKK